MEKVFAWLVRDKELEQCWWGFDTADLFIVLRCNWIPKWGFNFGGFTVKYHLNGKQNEIYSKAPNNDPESKFGN